MSVEGTSGAQIWKVLQVTCVVPTLFLGLIDFKGHIISKLADICSLYKKLRCGRNCL